MNYIRNELKFRLTSFANVVDLPGKPGAPTFTDVKDTTIVLHWAAPEDDGGAPITNYVIHCRQEDRVQWVQATDEQISKTEHKLTKLTQDAIYEFKVAAENKVGAGPFSDPSSPVKIKEAIGNSNHINYVFLTSLSFLFM